MKKKKPYVPTGAEAEVVIPDRNELAELIAALAFTVDGVVQAAVHQPTLFLRAAEFRMQAFRALAQADMAFDVAKAEAAIFIRTDARKIGERITEAGISELLEGNPTMQDLRRKLDQAKEKDEYAKLLLEAFRMRRDCIKVTADLTAAEVAMEKAVRAGAVQMDETRRRLREKYPG